MNPNPSNDAYTIVIFRGTTAKPLRISFSRRFFRNLVFLGAFLLLADIAIISHYVVRTEEVLELRSLRTEVLSSRQQVAAFSSAFDALKRRVVSIKEMNQRMRVMLGIDVERAEGDLLNGQGGEETPIENTIETQRVPGPQQSPAKTEPSVSMLPVGSVSFPTRDIADEEADHLEKHVNRNIKWLTGEIGVQEYATQRLMEEAEKRKNRWNSTPSIWPVRGWVTSGFGPRMSPFTGRPALHDGLDIGASPKTPVRAPAFGRVTAVGFDSKLGYIVRLAHGYGVETLYGHMAKYLVKSGQRVKRGDVIGLVGTSGLSTGPHLHYMVKVRGRAVNPRQYILE